MRGILIGRGTVRRTQDERDEETVLIATCHDKTDETTRRRRRARFQRSSGETKRETKMRRRKQKKKTKWEDIPERVSGDSSHCLVLSGEEKRAAPLLSPTFRHGHENERL